MCSRVEPQNLAQDFRFGFSPILNWFRIIGLDLKKSRSKKCRIFFKVYRFGWFLSCVSFNLILVIYLSNKTDETYDWMEEERTSQTFSTIYFLDSISDVIHPMGLHILLLFPFKRRWNDLWNSLDAMRQFVAADLNDKLRKISSIGVVYIITSVQLKA